MKDERDSDYLWDQSGAPDPDIVRLETVLGALRHRGETPAMPARTRASVVRRIAKPAIAFLSAAALVVIMAAMGWRFLTGGGWRVESMAGAPVVAGTAVSDSGRLEVGQWLVTDAASRAWLAVGRIGRVDVDPNSRVQLVEARGREHRIALERGTIHARIWAPPKFFFVNTPSAVAVDLGCAYTLQVDESGNSLIRVTHGWVAFETDRGQSYIPEGAVCATRKDLGPGTPRYEDAPSGYAGALATLDFGGAAHPDRAAALDLVLSQARRRDAFTLWHLLTRGTMEERTRVYERLASLVPPPASVGRDAVMRGDRLALDRWWDALGVQDSSWWSFLKKKF
jgi:hypothetical protein